MFTKKILALLLGISVLSCATPGKTIEPIAKASKAKLTLRLSSTQKNCKNYF